MSTLLIVAEGDAEIAFLRHLKATYHDELGRAVTVKNSNGGGGHRVLQLAIRETRAYHFMKTVVMLDNDAHWDEKDRRDAERAKIKVVESSPCLEATLLRICGHTANGVTAELKRQFAETFGCEAHNPKCLQQHFGRDVLDGARERVDELMSLMNHMGIKAR